MIFFTTAGFHRQPLGILVLRVRDVVNYELVKLVVIEGIPSCADQGFYLSRLTEKYMAT